ncbi:MAG: 30S ribosome-binding factor RbfA [Patescibacteria group bacterium]|nr:30S ribosome-binding factor RbfA [Patescibacteria group bacterium]
MSKRIEMVQKQLQRLLGEYFVKYGKDFDINFVSIDDIVISRDLGTAKVWVSFLSNANPDKTFQRLKKSSRAIQSYIYKHMPLRRVPNIKWIKGDGPGGQNRIEALLDDIKSDSEHSGSETDGPEGSEDFDSSSHQA